MIDFITKSGSHYRVDLDARTVECIAPPEGAFPPRKVAHGASNDHFSGPEKPAVGRRYLAFWADPREVGHTFMRTTEVVFVGEAGEALAL